MVLALDQAAWIVFRGYVTEPYVFQQRTKERNSFSNEHGHAGDDETLNQAGAQEPLNGDPAIDVEVVGSIGGEFRNNLSWRSGHLLHNRAARRG